MAIPVILVLRSGDEKRLGEFETLRTATEFVDAIDDAFEVYSSSGNDINVVPEHLREYVLIWEGSDVYAKIDGVGYLYEDGWVEM